MDFYSKNALGLRRRIDTIGKGKGLSYSRLTTNQVRPLNVSFLKLSSAVGSSGGDWLVRTKCKEDFT